MQLYNTLTHKKEDFVPVHEGKVSLYVCGITAYDYCHIGHARSAIVFDVLVRYFRYKGLKVHFVRNFTDIDDKIINRANAEGRDWKEVASTYMQAFHDDMDCLNVLRADEEPCATDYITQMQENIAHALGLPLCRVNVKATTEEGLGFTGSGDGIAANAVTIINTPEE